MNILIGSSIRRNPNILEAYLESIEKLNTEDMVVDYMFIDDNDNLKSVKLLADFKHRYKKNTMVIESNQIISRSGEFGVLKNGLHAWNNDLIARVALLKDKIIEQAIDKKYDFLFLVDSDIILHPDTLKHLVSLRKDIVSEIFWTDWKATGTTTPAVWLEDENDIVKKSELAGKDRFYEKRETSSFYAMLRVPGVYSVGGLGAITLVSRVALKKGVKYEQLDNVSFWGEDRHFCIRARALGLELWVDTNYPALHIYRDCLLANVDKFYKNGYKDQYARIPHNCSASSKLTKKKVSFVSNLKSKKRDLVSLHNFIRRKLFEKHRVVKDNPKLTLMMMVRNEGDRYLKDVLERLKPVLDYAVFLDNDSTDNTEDVIESVLGGYVEYRIIRNNSTGFDDESKARTKLWRETIKTKPDWIFALDADEIPERKLVAELPNLLNNEYVDIYSFKKYDMWDDKRYRKDGFWAPSYWALLIRYQPNFKYKYRRRKIHCERLPYNATSVLVNCNYPLKIKHMGWVKDADKERKYKQYLHLDPDGYFNPREHYESILDKNPVLEEFKD